MADDAKRDEQKPVDPTDPQTQRYFTSSADVVITKRVPKPEDKKDA